MNGFETSALIPNIMNAGRSNLYVQKLLRILQDFKIAEAARGAPHYRVALVTETD